MRIIYDKTTNYVIGVIAERVTAHLPPSFVGNNSTYIDVDYNDQGLAENPVAQLIDKEQTNLTTKVIHIAENGDITFTDQPPKQRVETNIVDLENPVLHKDVDNYHKKAKDLGTRVVVKDVDSRIAVYIMAGTKRVGIIQLEKFGCCTYRYKAGEVYDRKFYPHYYGFAEVINYLKEKGAKYLDMGGFTKNDEDLNKFKRKWGETKEVEVA